MAYLICSRCVMDESDPDILFDAAGVCNHCLAFDAKAPNSWKPTVEGRRELEGIVSRIKSEQRNREYDAVIGLSGGVDSSYLAYVAVREFGLRLLAVHVDGGWNSELAVRNIENIVRTLGIDLYTEVIDWEEMRDLQVAFLRASVANQDVPQDHAFFAALYRTAAKHDLRYVLSGGNLATESVMPFEWAYNAMDSRHLRAIHAKFGQGQLRSYPIVGFFDYYVRYPYLRRMTVIRPLNFLPYRKDEAITTLERAVGFQYYGGKHFESRFTKWQQLQFRPYKFGYDERRAYLSSLILSGQMTRAEALAELESDGYGEVERRADADYVRRKLGLSEAEFEAILSLPARTFRDYPSHYRLFSLKERFKRAMGKLGVRFKSK